MKIKNHISNWLALCAVSVMSCTILSCEDQPDKFELTSGVPTVEYVRVPNIESADSLITGAYLSSTVCLVGENLTSIKEIYFNDRQAVLNTSYITSNTLLVTVPGSIPDDVTDNMYMITAGNDTVAYPFQTLVPAPSIQTMNNEYLEAGKSGVIIGDYFADNDEVPLQLSISGVPIEIEGFDQYNIYFTMPDGVEEGSIQVTTRYGSTLSKFHYKETRGMLFDNWGQAGEEGTGLTNNGWASPDFFNDEYSIAGYYLQFGDGSTEIDETATNVWPQDLFEFDYHPGSWDTPELFEGDGASPRLSTFFNVADWRNMALKFELYVPSSSQWSSGALQVAFSGDDQITVGTQNNTWWRDLATDAAGQSFAGMGYGRALYRPWTSAEDGVFDTGNEWMTVTIPLETSFVYYLDGSAAQTTIDEKHFTGLMLQLYSGGVTGKPCKPILKIDNVRVVPYK